MFQESFKSVKCSFIVQWVFKGGMKGVSRMFKGSLKGDSRMFPGSFKGVLRKIEGCS